MPVTSSTKTYDCELCGAALQSKWALDNHMCLFHDLCGTVRPGAEVTFRCAQCGTSFARRSELVTHMESTGHGGRGGRADAKPVARRTTRGTPRRRS